MSVEQYSLVAHDWLNLEFIINDLASRVIGQNLSTISEPTFAELTLTGLTASRLIATDADSVLESSDLVSWVTGTTNQITVTDDTDGTVTLSTPQNIHTGATNFTVAGESIIPANSTTTALNVKATGDAANRFQIRADGLAQWGDGTNAVDTNLYRSAANYLKTDDTFEADIVYGTVGVAVKNANRLYLFTNNTSYYNSFQSPTGMGASVTYTLPSADGSIDQILKTNGSGVLSWTDNAPAGTPGGSDTEIQFNSSGVLDGISSLTFDGSNVFSTANTVWRGGTGIVLYDSDNSNFTAIRPHATTTGDTIYYLPADDGTAGQILSTDSAGNLSWVANAAVPAGDDYDIQYNASGSLGGTDEFHISYNTAPKYMQLTGAQLWMSNQSPIRFIETGGSNYVALKGPTAITNDVTYTIPEDGSNTQCLITNGSGTLSWTGHDGLLGFVSNEHIDHTAVTLTAGTGLTGGGDISANRTFDVDVGITDDKIVQIDGADIADDEYARFTANGLESRTAAEVLTDLAPDYADISSNDGATDVTAAQLEELTDGSETTLHSHAGGGGGSGYTSKCSVKLSSNQTIATATATKLEFDTEDYDTGNEWDSSTNYRFTATAEGYYDVSCAVSFGALGDQDVCIVQIKVNGTLITQVNVYASKNAGSPGIGYSKDLYLAANDYVEFFGYHDYGSNRVANSAYVTYATIHRFS